MWDKDYDAVIVGGSFAGLGAAGIGAHQSLALSGLTAADSSHSGRSGATHQPVGADAR